MQLWVQEQSEMDALLSVNDKHPLRKGCALQAIDSQRLNRDDNQSHPAVHDGGKPKRPVWQVRASVRRCVQHSRYANGRVPTLDPLMKRSFPKCSKRSLCVRSLSITPRARWRLYLKRGIHLNVQLLLRGLLHHSNESTCRS